MEITMDKNYIVKAARDNEEGIREYYKNSKYNYVITENGKPLCWKNGCPVVYGDVVDATYEISTWREPFKNVSVVNEREILDTFCKEEVEKAIKEEDENIFLTDTGNNHDEHLVKKLNDLWRKAHIENDTRRLRNFEIILKALYKRDANEILNNERFGWGDDMTEEKVYDKMCTAWVSLSYDYLKGVADDGDLETIITFVR